MNLSFRSPFSRLLALMNAFIAASASLPSCRSLVSLTSPILASEVLKTRASAELVAASVVASVSRENWSRSQRS